VGASVDEPTADQLDLEDPGNGPGEQTGVPIGAQVNPGALFDATVAAAAVSLEGEPPVVVELSEPEPVAVVPPAEAAPRVPQIAPEPPSAAVEVPIAIATSPWADAVPEPTPEAVAEPGIQPSLLDSSEAAVAVAAVPPAAAAKASDLTGATNVATYGDRDLDEMVAELAAAAPASGTVAAGDEVAAAAAASAAQAEGEETTPGDPDVAPIAEQAAVADLEAVAVAEPAAESVSAPTWPFLIYAGVWAVYAVGLALVMKSAASGGSLFASPYYRAFLWGGLALAIVGPCLVLLVWLVSRRSHEKGHRGGLFSSALLKGALALFVGVVLWWAAYYAAVWLAASGR